MSVGCFHPPNCCATCIISVFYPKSADNHYLLLVRVARGWKTFVGRSLGHHRGHSSPSSSHTEGRTDSPDMFQSAGENQITYWYEPENESHSTEPWSPLCWLIPGDDLGLHLEAGLTVSFMNPPEKLSGSFSRPPNVPTALLFAFCCQGNMMYETHTVPTSSYKFAWLVNWWEGG